MIDILDPEYAMPVALDCPAPVYDLRTYDQRTDDRLDAHERRIAEVEQRLSRLERMVAPALHARPCVRE